MTIRRFLGSSLVVLMVSLTATTAAADSVADDLTVVLDVGEGVENATPSFSSYALADEVDLAASDQLRSSVNSSTWTGVAALAGAAGRSLEPLARAPKNPVGVGVALLALTYALSPDTESLPDEIELGTPEQRELRRRLVAREFARAELAAAEGEAAKPEPPALPIVLPLPLGPLTLPAVDPNPPRPEWWVPPRPDPGPAPSPTVEPAPVPAPPKPDGSGGQPRAAPAVEHHTAYMTDDSPPGEVPPDPAGGDASQEPPPAEGAPVEESAPTEGAPTGEGAPQPRRSARERIVAAFRTASRWLTGRPDPENDGNPFAAARKALAAAPSDRSQDGASNLVPLRSPTPARSVRGDVEEIFDTVWEETAESLRLPLIELDASSIERYRAEVEAMIRETGDANQQVRRRGDHLASRRQHDRVRQLRKFASDLEYVARNKRGQQVDGYSRGGRDWYVPASPLPNNVLSLDPSVRAVPPTEPRDQ